MHCQSLPFRGGLDQKCYGFPIIEAELSKSLSFMAAFGVWWKLVKQMSKSLSAVDVCAEMKKSSELESQLLAMNRQGLVSFVSKAGLTYHVPNNVDLFHSQKGKVVSQIVSTMESNRGPDATFAVSFQAANAMDKINMFSQALMAELGIKDDKACKWEADGQLPERYILSKKLKNNSGVRSSILESVFVKCFLWVWEASVFKFV